MNELDNLFLRFAKILAKEIAFELKNNQLNTVKNNINHLSDNKDCLISEDEASNILGCTPRKLQSDRIKGGGIPYIKVGRLVRYHKQDVENYIKNKKRQNTSQT